MNLFRCISFVVSVLKPFSTFPFLERYDIGFLKRPDVVALERMSVDGATGAQSTSGAYDAALVAQAKKVLRRRWSEFMLVDLGSFTQRYRLRTTVFKTMRAMEKFAKQEGGKDLFGSPKAMEAAHAFLVLVRELVTSNFFSPIYEVYPRCELVIGGVKEEPFFYRRTKQMLTGTPAQVRNAHASFSPWHSYPCLLQLVPVVGRQL